MWSWISQVNAQFQLGLWALVLIRHKRLQLRSCEMNDDESSGPFFFQSSNPAKNSIAPDLLFLCLNFEMVVQDGNDGNFSSRNCKKVDGACNYHNKLQLPGNFFRPWDRHQHLVA